VTSAYGKPHVFDGSLMVFMAGVDGFDGLVGGVDVLYEPPRRSMNCHHL
jgi:hypothetical protein